jgi:hypothetical protein
LHARGPVSNQAENREVVRTYWGYENGLGL